MNFGIEGNDREDIAETASLQNRKFLYSLLELNLDYS